MIRYSRANIAIIALFAMGPIFRLQASDQLEKNQPPGTNVSGSYASIESDGLTPLAQIPVEEHGLPAPGRRVSVTEPEYIGTDVHHSLYLPKNFADRTSHPIIVEYTGNYFPPAGSTGRVEDAHLGYALTLGRDFIWVVLPFISKDHRQNEVTWWGDEDATVAYAKICISRIIKKYHVDPDKVILCGFSRGAIAASYIGLHDDDISKLWSAFFTSANFDGVHSWLGTTWGSPLEKYRADAIKRLQRVQGRPWWVSQDKSVDDVTTFLKDTGLFGDNFILDPVPMKQLFPKIPKAYFISAHTDMWPLFNNPSSNQASKWIYKIGGVK